MLHSFNRRCAVVAALVLVSVLGAGCQSADVAAPRAPQQRAASAVRAAHDDDPATCRNGYIITDGHIYCNPF